jgi:SAM-dependent methyltransferase
VAPTPAGRRRLREAGGGVFVSGIVRGLPLSPGSIDGIYCSHVLEHLSYEDLRRSLRNTRSNLREGGIFRLVLPDLRRLALAYVESQDEDACCRFMRDSSLGSEKRTRGFRGLLRHLAGNAAHLWMRDFPALSRQLREASFTDIRRAAFGDSAEPQFAEVENPDRWAGTLGIECRAAPG